MISASQIARAAKFSTATLHEAAGRRGALPAALRPLAPDLQLCGIASTVECPAGDNLWLHHAIATAPAGAVLIAQTGAVQFGYWGEIMTIAAQQRGLAGLVIAGGIRDSVQIVELGFPVFCETVCIRGTVKNPHAGGRLGGALQLGDIVVESGHLIRGDADGLVAIAPGELAEVLAAAEAREREEVRIVEQLRRGSSTLDLYGLPAIPA